MDNKKLEQLKNLMKENGVDQILISDPASIFYLTGRWVFPMHRLYTLTIDLKENYHLCVHEMFKIEENIGAEKHYFKDTQDSVAFCSEYVIENGTLCIDKEWPARFLLRLMELRPNLKIVATPLIESVRRIKNPDEIQLMREASKANDDAIGMLIKNFDPSWTEKMCVQKVAGYLEELGTGGHSFDPIYGFGKNCTDPHHMTDDSLVKEGDSMILDMGCIKNAYCSDMTRTVFYKTCSDKQKEVYNIVLEAQLRAINGVKPGAKFCEIDALARDYITEKGYGEYFNHRLGHCIGMEVHEDGDVSAINQMELKEGMIFSIEPGIYLPGEFGVRIEDLIVVTKDGHENLNHYPKELQIIGN